MPTHHVRLGTDLKTTDCGKRVTQGMSVTYLFTATGCAPCFEVVLKRRQKIDAERLEYFERKRAEGMVPMRKKGKASRARSKR